MGNSSSINSNTKYIPPEIYIETVKDLSEAYMFSYKLGNKEMKDILDAKYNSPVLYDIRKKLSNMSKALKNLSFLLLEIQLKEYQKETLATAIKMMEGTVVVRKHMMRQSPYSTITKPLPTLTEKEWALLPILPGIVERSDYQLDQIAENSLKDVIKKLINVYQAMSNRRIADVLAAPQGGGARRKKHGAAKKQTNTKKRKGKYTHGSKSLPLSGIA